MSKYTQKTLKALGEQGCLTGMVERFIAQAGKAIPVNGNPQLRRRTGIRKDLFGIIDLIALRPIEILHPNCESKNYKTWELVGVQSFGQDFAEHKRKVLASKAAPIWLASGNQIEIWGWRKLKVKRGGKAEVWTPRIYRFKKEDFTEHKYGRSIQLESTPMGGNWFYDQVMASIVANENTFTVEDL